MQYRIFGKRIEILSMQKPERLRGTTFEIVGTDSLNHIGLEKRFWFRAPFYFSNEGPMEYINAVNEPKNDEQWILSILLHKSIISGNLQDQFAFK